MEIYNSCAKCRSHLVHLISHHSSSLLFLPHSVPIKAAVGATEHLDLKLLNRCVRGQPGATWFRWHPRVTRGRFLGPDNTRYPQNNARYLHYKGFTQPDDPLNTWQLRGMEEATGEAGQNAQEILPQCLAHVSVAW